MSQQQSRPLLRRSLTASGSQASLRESNPVRPTSSSIFGQSTQGIIPVMKIQQDVFGPFCMVLVQNESNGAISYIRDHNDDLTVSGLESSDKIPMSMIDGKLHVLVDGEHKPARTYQQQCFDVFMCVSSPYRHGSFSKIMKFKSISPELNSERSQSMPSIQSTQFVPESQSLDQIITVTPTTNTRINPNKWFEHLFGFEEKTVGQQPGMIGVNMTAVRNCFELDNQNHTLESRINGEKYGCGTFTTPTLDSLRQQVNSIDFSSLGQTTLSHIAGDSFDLHSDPRYRDATFQAASQFNCLEFPSPHSTPESGVTNYVGDRTQGPACALAAPFGTIYRNYFVEYNGQIGQSTGNQINNLDNVLDLLGATTLINVNNGYTSSDTSRMTTFNQIGLLNDLDVYETALGLLKVGVHSNVEVPWKAGQPRFVLAPKEERQNVTQVYCSGLALGQYTNVSTDLWASLAKLVLKASYEATLLTAALERNAGRGNGTVLLTLIGGGVFGNKLEWIAEAISHAISKCKNMGLTVIVTHYGSIDSGVKNLIDGMIQD